MAEFSPDDFKQWSLAMWEKEMPTGIARETIVWFRHMCDRYGSDGHGDTPADMSATMYWLQHLKEGHHLYGRMAEYAADILEPKPKRVRVAKAKAQPAMAAPAPAEEAAPAAPAAAMSEEDLCDDWTATVVVESASDAKSSGSKNEDVDKKDLFEVDLPDDWATLCGPGVQIRAYSTHHPVESSASDAKSSGSGKDATQDSKNEDADKKDLYEIDLYEKGLGESERASLY